MQVAKRKNRNLSSKDSVAKSIWHQVSLNYSFQKLNFICKKILELQLPPAKKSSAVTLSSAEDTKAST